MKSKYVSCLYIAAMLSSMTTFIGCEEIPDGYISDGVGQIVREHAQQVLGIVECVLPGCIVVPDLASFVRRHIAVFLYVCL